MAGMSPETFGCFPAAIILVERLEKLADEKVTTKVSRFLQDYNEGLYYIGQIPHESYRKRCALLWRDDFLHRSKIDPFIDKYLENIICTYAKDLLVG